MIALSTIGFKTLQLIDFFSIKNKIFIESK